MIRSAKQLAIVKAFLNAHAGTKDWLNLTDVVNRNSLDYYDSRRFLLKLVRNNFVVTRHLHRKIQPLDFRLTPDGYSELMGEYLGIMSRNGK